MDSLFRRLIAVALLFACVLPLAAHAQDTGPMCADRSAALAAAQADVAAHPGWSLWTGPVVHGCNSNGQCMWTGAYGIQGNGVVATANWSCPDVVPPKNPCDGMKSYTQNYAGKVLNGFKTCMGNPQPDGSTVQCSMSFHASSDPVRNDWGNWNTFGTLSPTGDVCGQGPGDGGGWDTGAAPPAGPPPPPPGPPKDDPPKDPPRLCGNVSCYDPKTGDYCTQADSGTVCAKGPPPNPGGSGPPQDGGGCSSGGDVTACAGKPNAPPPPADKVPDPPTATGGSDHYVHADANTGVPYTTTTTVYNNGGGGASSGATTGDTKPPASSSSSGGSGGTGDDKKGDDTSASGGGDCGNPPYVSGSPALGMVALQAWQTRCSTEKVHKDLTGDGTSPGDITTPSGKSAWGDAPSSGDAVADAANKGNYDSGGMGFSTACPMHDLEVPLWDGRSFSIAFSKGCDVGVWIRALVIAFALFAAAKITVGGNN